MPGAGGSAGTPKREAAAGNAPGWRTQPSPAQPALAPTSCSQPPRVPPTVAGTMGCARNGPDRQRLEAENPRQGDLRAPAPGSIAGCPCPPPYCLPFQHDPRRRWRQRRADGRPGAGHPSCAAGSAPTWHKPKARPLLQPIARGKVIAKIFAKLIARTMSSSRRSVYKLFSA